jgi:hypothetical protein
MAIATRNTLALGSVLMTAMVGLACVIAAPPVETPSVEFDATGKLKLPIGYRQWVYVGAAVTPNDLNGGMALFPEFHCVYIDPESYAHYEKTGEYRDGAVIAKELISLGAKDASSGKGYFMGDFLSLEIAIKDAKRFKDEPGSWAYFSFDDKRLPMRTAAKHATVSCNKCHQDNAEHDFVFSQDYPVLRAVGPRKN